MVWVVGWLDLMGKESAPVVICVSSVLSTHPPTLCHVRSTHNTCGQAEVHACMLRLCNWKGITVVAAISFYTLVAACWKGWSGTLSLHGTTYGHTMAD